MGEMIQFDEHIFQMGWNHQLETDIWRGGEFIGRIWQVSDYTTVSFSHLKGTWK